MESKKTFYIKTFGCQMNTADSEKMSSLLLDSGMKAAPSPDDADVILVNGCSVREKAVHKAVSSLGRFREWSKNHSNPNPSLKSKSETYKRKAILGVGGCVGQLEKDQLFKAAPYLDFVFGPDAIDELPEILHRVEQGERHVLYTEFDRDQKYSTETKIYGAKAQAYVNIMKGCDKYCSYCIVPFTRGREKSRTINEVLDDLARLVNRNNGNGIKEVTLLGQNVNSFGKGNSNTQNRVPYELNNVIGKVGPREGDENFPQLLHAIEKDPRLSDLKRIRFTSSHPLDFSDELIECYGPKNGVSKLAQHLHLPVQSGSNTVLQKMGRHHRIEHYISQMNRLREISPQVGLSTDLIVGFPTETEENFQETLQLLDVMQYDQVYAFAYSSRPGTRAAKLKDDVPLEVKKERLNQLLDHQEKISEKKYNACVGREMEVLVEGLAKNQKMNSRQEVVAKGTVWVGRTSCFKLVHFLLDSPRNLVGQLVNVQIERASPLALYGKAIVLPIVSTDSKNIGLASCLENTEKGNHQWA